MKPLRKRIVRLLQNGSIIDEDERQKLEVLIKTKKWNPYCIRHSAITSDSDYLPEYALKKKVRWSMNSKQSARYIKRRMGNDLKQKILVQNSIISEQEMEKKCEVLRHNLSKNAPVEVTGVARFNTASCFSTSSNNGGYDDDYNISKNNNDNINTCFGNEPIVVQSLQQYVLPVLPSTPLHIHKMQFKLKIASEYYCEIAGPFNRDNKSKAHEEIIGGALVTYRFYPNGTIMVFTESSNNAFKLQDEADHSSLIAFFGQVRDRLVNHLADTHERIAHRRTTDLLL